MVCIFVNGFFNCICIIISFIFNMWIFIYIKISCNILEKGKQFISSETRLSSEIILSSLSTSVTLLAIFHFSENNGWIFFQKVLLSTILMDQAFQNISFPPSYTIYCRSFFVFCTFSLILEFIFWNRGFLNMTFSWLPF